MKIRFVFGVLCAIVLALSTLSAHAQVGPNATFIEYNSAANPCQSTSIVKNSAVLNISATGTTAVIAAVTGTKIYVCGLVSTVAGTAPSILFLTGTQTTTACDTGAANLSGTLLPASGSTLVASLPGGLFKTGTSGQLCATAGGTTPSFQGVISYVQQ